MEKSNRFVYLFLNNWIGKYDNEENIYRQNFLNVSSFFFLLLCFFSLVSVCLYCSFVALILFHIFLCRKIFFIIIFTYYWRTYSISLIIWLENCVSKHWFLLFWLMMARQISVCSMMKCVYISILCPPFQMLFRLWRMIVISS